MIVFAAKVSVKKVVAGVLENTVAVKSALADGQRAALEALADEIAAQVKA